MGYAVPAAIGAKLARPERQVVAIVGDGAFLMTGLEIVTATTHQAGVAFFVFHDGELSQISQGQEIPYNRKTCTVLGEIRLDGIALATGAAFVSIRDDDGDPERHRRGAARRRHGPPRRRGRRDRLRQAHAVHAGRREHRAQALPSRRQVSLRRPRLRAQDDGLTTPMPLDTPELVTHIRAS